jgi:PIN domain nuclease of toxin-antitoxin system
MNPPFILDTCTCLWLLAGELPSAALETLTATFNSGATTYVSPITALEVGTLARKRRFRSQLTPQRWLESLLSQPGMALAQMPAELLMESALLPGDLQADPHDRVIAATAREYGYTLLTRDAGLLRYAQDGYLSALKV